MENEKEAVRGKRLVTFGGVLMLVGLVLAAALAVAGGRYVIPLLAGILGFVLVVIGYLQRIAAK